MSRAPTTLLCLLCCSSLLFDGAVAIHIGVIVNTKSLIGREQKIAIETAAHHLNSSTTTLFLNLSDSNGMDPLQANANAKSLIGWGAEVIIATGTWPEVVTVAGIGDKSRIPVVSLATTSPSTLSPRPFLVRMSYPASGQVRCLAEVVKSYNWRQVILIYEDDDYGSIAAIASLLSEALDDVGSKIIDHVAFPALDTLTNPKAIVQKELTRINGSLSKVYVILRSSPSLAPYLFKEAKELGMMEKGHVWIANDDITALLDLTLEPSFISSYMQGVVGIKAYFNEKSDPYHDFYAEFHRRFKAEEYGGVRESCLEPGKFAVRAYDAVHAIGHAAVETKMRRKATLLEGLLSSKFVGLSGLIRFRSDGGLPEGKGYSAFRVINVVGKSYREMGFWLEGFGFYKEEGEMVRRGPQMDALTPVYWPGGPERVPSGWGKLRIGVPGHTTFDQFVKVEYEGNKVREVTGFCIDVFNETLKRLKYELDYEFFPYNGSYDDLINQIPSEVYDAVVGDTTILAKRSMNVTFTDPFLSSGLSMLVPLRTNHTPWMLTKPFTVQVWLLIIATLVYTGIIMWYLEHKINPEFNGPWWTQLGATFWLILSTIFFAHGKIYSYYTKIVVAVWLIAVLILTSSFTANLSSILTVEKFEPVVADSKVGCDGDSFVLKYLQEALGYKEKNIEKILNAEDYVKAFENRSIEAAFLEVPYLRVFLSKHHDYTVHGKTYMLGGFGFAFPKGSPMAVDFSEAILGLTENGMLKSLEKKWFSLTLSNYLSPVNNRNRDSLSLDSFWALFLFTGGTSTIIFLIFKARSTFHRVVGILRERFEKIWRSRNFKEKEEFELQTVVTISSDQEESGVSAEQRPSDHMIELHHHAHNDIEQNHFKTKMEC